MGKTNKELIEEGKQFLAIIKTRDIGLDLTEDVLDEKVIPALNKWFLQVKINMKGTALEEEVDKNSWIINGTRVSRERLSTIVSILELAVENDFK